MFLCCGLCDTKGTSTCPSSVGFAIEGEYMEEPPPMANAIEKEHMGEPSPMANAIEKEYMQEPSPMANAIEKEHANPYGKDRKKQKKDFRRKALKFFGKSPCP